MLLINNILVGSNVFRIDGISYKIISDTDNTLEVTDTYRGRKIYYEGSIVIPGTVSYMNKHYHVTSIGERAFDGCRSLTSITLPDGVTSIGKSAFYFCRSLTSITLPNSLTSIGEFAFAYCDSLTSITIPCSVTQIGQGVFEGSHGLRVIVNYSNLDIDVDVNGCRVVKPDGVIGDFVFEKNQDNYYLSAYIGEDSVLTLPKNYKDNDYYIGERVFSECVFMTSITLPDGVTSIGQYAFYGCRSLTSITIPDGVTSIGEGAFYDCIYNHRTTKTNQKYPSVNL